MSRRRSFEVTVSAEAYDTFTVEAESHDEAEEKAKELFRDERPNCMFDDIRAEAETVDDGEED